jgi:hypothetical protein
VGSKQPAGTCVEPSDRPGDPRRGAEHGDPARGHHCRVRFEFGRLRQVVSEVGNPQQQRFERPDVDGLAAPAVIRWIIGWVSALMTVEG